MAARSAGAPPPTRPPAHLLINSPYDPEARYAGKRDLTWVGYKAYLTETCEPDAPQVVTHAETTPATTHDGRASRQSYPFAACVAR